MGDSERKRSCLDDVPMQMKRIRKGSLPSIRDDAGATDNLLQQVMTLVLDTVGHNQKVSASMRGRQERPLGRRVGRRVHGETDTNSDPV